MLTIDDYKYLLNMMEVTTYHGIQGAAKAVEISTKIQAEIAKLQKEG